jgi:hypothetical protein
MTANTTGGNNTAIGYQALSSNTTGTNNVGLGYTANITLNSASNTTVVGYNAVSNNSNSVALGANTQANNTQATAIGNSAQANGSNSAAIGNGATTSQNNAFILGNSSVNVGIGTSTPNTSAKLDVNGAFKLGANGTVLTNVYKTSVSVNLPFLILGLVTSPVTVAVSNAPLGATVIVNPQSALPSGLGVAYSYVSSANNVTIVFNALIGVSAGQSRTFDVTVIY